MFLRNLEERGIHGNTKGRKGHTDRTWSSPGTPKEITLEFAELPRIVSKKLGRAWNPYGNTKSKSKTKSVHQTTNSN